MSALESAAGGPTHHYQRLRRLAVALLLAGVTAPVYADAVTAAGAQTQPENSNRDIIVTAPLFRDVTPEAIYDEDAIESYGVSTIDELLGEVQVELGDDSDQPLILVNGKRISDLDEIGALPIEALRNLQVLPRGSAVRLGGTTGQRVISLTLNRKVATETLTAASKIATDGDWYGGRGEALFTRVRGDTRLNLSLRGRGESNLLESDRGIVQPVPFRPYAIGGNITGYPNTSGEIDPLLSALAGEIVTVAPVPDAGSPSLGDFLANANKAAVTDLGQFRTLRPATRNYEFNGTFATPLASWLSGTATVRVNRNTTDSQRGLPSALFILPATNPASPFSRDVGLAYYGADPLRYSARTTAGEGNVTLNATWGSWSGNFNARHSESRTVSSSDRQTSFGFIPLGDNVDPFTADLTPLIGIGSGRTSSHSFTTLGDLSVTGPLLALPAGPVQSTLEGTLGWDGLRGESNYSAFGNQNVHRNQQSIRAALDIPLTARGGFGGAIGNLTADAEYSLFHYSSAGSVDNRTFGATWEPHPVLRLHVEYQENQQPAPIEILGDPIIVTNGVRMFDPLTGETVDVTQITGGNPDLLPQKTSVRRVNALLRLLPSWNLQLNAEYTDTDRRNFVSSLPEASAAVTLAFPDRYVRDSNGVLTSVDLRPVNFDSDREKRLRWGISMNKRLAGAPVANAGSGQRSGSAVGARRPPTYFQLTANHTMVFSDEIRIRPGLGSVDLLNGGAIGIGGGRLRHQVDATAALNSGGTGARIGVTWRSRSTLESRIGAITDTLDFSPMLLINARAFTDLKRFLPQSKWAKGFRVSLDVVNATNNRQSVRDSLAHTPLQYQPAYRDALGRTIEIELRKVF